MTKIKLILGPCVIERSQQWLVDRAGEINDVVVKLNDGDIDFYFKCSFNKANRTSVHSYRGVTITEFFDGMQTIQRMGIKTTTDIHDVRDPKWVANCVDMIQIPAFLCRQTDLIQSAVSTGLPVNIKKGQFLSPEEAVQVYGKARALGGQEVYITERGTSFGYNRLVVDIPGMVSIANRVPLIFDCTHSLQLPGGRGPISGGQRFATGHLSRAVAATGICDGYFAEVHPEPDMALSDPYTQLPLNRLEPWLESLLKIHREWA